MRGWTQQSECRRVTGVEPGFRSCAVFGKSKVRRELAFFRLRSFSYICQILAHLHLRHEQIPVSHTHTKPNNARTHTTSHTQTTDCAQSDSNTEQCSQTPAPRASSREQRQRGTTRYFTSRDGEIVAVHGSHSPSPIVSGGSEAHTRRCRRGGAFGTSSASYHLGTHVAAGHGRPVAHVHQVLRCGHTCLTRRCSRGRT